MKNIHFLLIQLLVKFVISTNNNQHSIDLVNQIIFNEKNLNKLNDNEINNNQKAIKDVSHRYEINQLEPDLASTIFDNKKNGNKNPLQRTTTIHSQQSLVDLNDFLILQRGFLFTYKII